MLDDGIVDGRAVGVGQGRGRQQRRDERGKDGSTHFGRSDLVEDWVRS